MLGIEVGSPSYQAAPHPCTPGGSGRPSAVGFQARSTRRAGGAAVSFGTRRRAYSRPCGASGPHRGERWHFPPQQCRPVRAGALLSVPLSRRVTACSVRCWRVSPGGRPSTSCAAVAWLAVGCIRPVLKHGPRSAAGARVVRVSKPDGAQ